MKQGNPSIEWSQKSGKEYLRFTFGESFTANEADKAIVEWKEAFQSRNDRSIVMVWDCKNMKGYDSEARSKWTESLKEMKPKIASIWVITDSSLIKMGASVMGMLSSLKIKAIASENEIVM